jgi:hypothetical protein
MNAPLARGLLPLAGLLVFALAPACSKAFRATPAPFSTPTIVADTDPVRPGESPSDAGSDSQPDADVPSPGTAIARRLDAPGLALGNFALAAPAGAAHPNGVIDALAWTDDASQDLYAVAFDVATGRELGRVRIGPGNLEDEGEQEAISSVPGGVVLAAQGKTSMELYWLDAGAVIRSHRTLPGLGTELRFRLRGLVGFGDRIVMASDGSRKVTVQLLDEKGSLLASHSCRGALYAPGSASFGQVGDQVVLTNLWNLDESSKANLNRVCGFHLHGSPRWNEALVPWGDYFERQGVLYFSETYSHVARAVSDDLRATGAELPRDQPAPEMKCSGLPGSARSQDGWIGHAEVIHLISCCGDERPTGIYVCSAPEPAPAASR